MYADDLYACVLRKSPRNLVEQDLTTHLSIRLQGISKIVLVSAMGVEESCFASLSVCHIAQADLISNWKLYIVLQLGSFSCRNPPERAKVGFEEECCKDGLSLQCPTTYIACRRVISTG